MFQSYSEPQVLHYTCYGLQPIPSQEKNRNISYWKGAKEDLLDYLLEYRALPLQEEHNTAYKQRGGIITEKQEKRHQKCGKPSSKSLFSCTH